MTNNFANETKVEKRYYIKYLNDIELISEFIKRYCSVENELHWHMFVILNEYANTTMNKHAIDNLSIIKKNILMILKLLQPLYGN